MAGFHYEKNLPHQDRAVRAVLSVFDKVHARTAAANQNPELVFAGRQLQDNIAAVQRANGIEGMPFAGGGVLDIAMETGTGKTYAYAKTLFELHRQLGVFKFIIVVPTLSIKAGTKNFLQSEALARHFRLDFEGAYRDAHIALYVVESQKAKGKSAGAPADIVRFVAASDAKKIHVLLINAGMVNSDTLAGKTGDGSTLIHNEFSVPLDALASVRPFVVVDEPHRFPKDKTTWGNIKKLKPPFILRYGATFAEHQNLLYRLTAVDAFNDDLVKGIRVFTEAVEGDDGTRIRLLALDGKEATFEVGGKAGKKTLRLAKGDALSMLHPLVTDLQVDNLNKSTLVLSNGVELKKGDSLNPFSYADAVFEKMLRQAVREHFRLERELLLRPGGRIKPLSLFFIDDIAGYRDGNQLAGSLKSRFEACVKAEAQNCLKNETDAFYRAWLEKTLADVEATHGGYFAQDNSDKDEKIERQVHEILYDKEALLSLDNPRRFIFSKWTLREGWDNPNVFQICKLRSSGSETSKLQEVGRGLRLPVNEYMARVKDGGFRLHYFVDASESEFVQKLVGEVNRSVAQEVVYTALNDELVKKIQGAYPEETAKSIRAKLAHLTDDNDNFMDGGLSQAKHIFADAFGASPTLKDGKIDHAGRKTHKVAMRAGKYDELKTLWEAINRKALLHYKIESETEFAGLFYAYLIENRDKFAATGIRTVQSDIRVSHGLLDAVQQASAQDEDFEPVCTMKYPEFLLKLSQAALIRMDTLHAAFHRMRGRFDITRFMNERTIHAIKSGFNRWLLLNSFTDFQVGYSHVGGSVHPTKFTDGQGQPLPEVNAADLGVQSDAQREPLPQYLFESVFFDSELERENITDCRVEEVVVFTKIPKNSIKIPVAGGATYSPDFAYIVKTAKGEVLNFVLESKNVPDNAALREEEKKKIEHAQKLFEAIAGEVKVVFQTQFEGDKVAAMLRAHLAVSQAA